MMKKINLKIFVMFMFVCCVLASGVKVSAAEFGDFLYEVQEDGTVGIIKYIGTDTIVVIPDEIDGKKVTFIADDTFPSKTYEKVVIGRYVEMAEQGSFFYMDAKEIVLPESIKELNIYYSKVETIRFASYTKEFPDQIFKPTGLKEIVVDNDNPYYKGIDGVLFDKNGEKLIAYPKAKQETEYLCPDETKIIRENAFNGNYYIEKVIFNTGLECIEANAFNGCSNLKDYKMPDTLNYLGEAAFANTYSEIDEIVIPDNIEILRNSTFGCTKITRLKLGKNMRVVEGLAFKWISELVITGSQLESFGFDALEPIDKLILGKDCFLPENVLLQINNWNSFNHYECEEGNPFYEVEDNVLYNKNKEVLLVYPKTRKDEKYEIKASVTKIAKKAFASNQYLKEIICPERVTVIENGAFSYMDALEKIYLNGSNISIGDRAFAESDKITEIIGLSNIIEIGKEAFYGCSSLTGSLNLKNCHKIGERAFSFCDKVGELTLSDSCTEIGKEAFQYCNAIKEIIIPDSVTELGKHIFYDMYRLEKIVFGKGVTKLDEEYIENTPNLKIVEIPSEVEQIFSYMMNFTQGVYREQITIRGYNKSEAQRYASEWSLSFEKIPWERTKAPSNFRLGMVTDNWIEFFWDSIDKNIEGYKLYKNGYLLQNIDKTEQTLILDDTQEIDNDVYEIVSVNLDGVDSERSRLLISERKRFKWTLENVDGKYYLFNAWIDKDEEDLDLDVTTILGNSASQTEFQLTKENGKYTQKIEVDKITEDNYYYYFHVKYKGRWLLSGRTDFKADQGYVSEETFGNVKASNFNGDIQVTECDKEVSKVIAVIADENRNKTILDVKNVSVKNNLLTGILPIEKLDGKVYNFYLLYFDKDGKVIGHSKDEVLNAHVLRKINVAVNESEKYLGGAYVRDYREYYAGEEVTVVAVPVNDLVSTFVGWYLDGKKVSEKEEYTFKMENRNRELMAAFRENEKFTVQLHSELSGIQCHGDGVYYRNSSINVWTPITDTDMRYEFAGWYQKDGTLFSQKHDLYLTVQHNIDLTAKYKLIKKPVVPALSSITANLKNGSIYIKGTRLSLTCKESGAVIYYTTDGTIPTKQSLRYDAKKGIVLNKDTKVQAIAYKDGYKESGIFSGVYYIRRPEVYEDFTVGNYNYRVMTFDKRKQTGTVTCMGQRKRTKSVAIPGTVNYLGFSMKVVRVSNYAFKGNGKLQVVKLHKNITAIGKSVFENCSSLQKVYLGDGVKSIGDKAFVRCSKLKSITGTKRLESIGRQTFYYCTSLKKFQIESTKLKKVGKDAFRKINKKAVIKVPKKKYKTYKKLLKNKGQGKKVKIRY